MRAADFFDQAKANAFQYQVVFGRPHDNAVFDDPDVAGGGLAQVVAAKHDGLDGASVKTDLAGKHGAQQAGALDMGLFPAEIVGGDAGHAFASL